MAALLKFCLDSWINFADKSRKSRTELLFLQKKPSKRSSVDVKITFDNPADCLFDKSPKFLRSKSGNGKKIFIFFSREMFLPKNFSWTRCGLAILPKIFRRKLDEFFASSAKVLKRNVDFSKKNLETFLWRCLTQFW